MTPKCGRASTTRKATTMRDFLALIRHGLNVRDMAAAVVMASFLIMLALLLPEVIG
jgi:hypothetical protein